MSRKVPLFVRTESKENHVKRPAEVTAGLTPRSKKLKNQDIRYDIIYNFTLFLSFNFFLPILAMLLEVRVQ